MPSAVMIFGCGYVGTALAAHLLRMGVRVGALTRNVEKAERLRSMGVQEVVVGDLDAENWHTALKQRYEAVVNCVSSAGGGIDGYRKSYLNGQASILNWARGRGIQRYLYTSSTSVYPQDGGVSVDEDASTDGAPATGAVLVEAENLLLDAEAICPTRLVFRLAGIYGPKRHYLLDQLKSAEGGARIAGYGDFTLNLIHLEDIVGALWLGLSNVEVASGIYNLADDGAVHKEVLVRWLAESLGLEPPFFDPSLTTARLQRRGGRMPDRLIVNAKSKAKLGWSPKFPSFREGYMQLLVDPENT